MRKWGYGEEQEQSDAFSSLATQITRIRGSVPVMFLYGSEKRVSMFSLI